MAIRDAARVALAAGELTYPEHVALSRLLDASSADAHPVELKRSTIGRYLNREVRTVTAYTTGLALKGWIWKQARRVRLASGEFRGICSRYGFVGREPSTPAVPADPVGRPRVTPPRPRQPPAGSVIVAVPIVHRDPLPGTPISPDAARALRMAQRARADARGP